MSYPKKSAADSKAKSATKGTGSRLTEEKREKLVAIQQREQLKGMLVNKFLEKYGNKQGGSNTNQHITNEVNDFLKNEKLTEENLRKLEQRIKEGPGGVEKNRPPSQLQSQPKNTKQEPKQVDRQSQNGGAETKSQVSFKKGYKDDDAISDTSSTRPKSIYVQEDEDDEWATMLKHDAELYKRELELEKHRDFETKNKVKEELERQILEKKRLELREKDLENHYVNAVQTQMSQYDERERKKEAEKKEKILQEKLSRDRQLRDEHLRKKQEVKAEGQIDQLLVTKIKEEIDSDQHTALKRKEEERQHLRKVLHENEEYKKRMLEEAKREKETDIRAQKEYTRLLEQQEAERAAEVKAREERSKKLMSMMADTVIKDQKEQILEEERKLLRHHQERESRETEEENRRKQRQHEQKKEMAAFLDKQKYEKELREKEEKEFERRQAELWKKDTEEYNMNEKKKMETIRDINKKNAEFLKQQMELEKKKQKKKMNVEEALLNKDKLRYIAETDENERFHKEKVTGKP